MNNVYYGVATTPNDDFLAHYGVKGMKWGIRRALERGSDKAMRRQWNKAVKKLNKLEKQGASGKKYAKRAVAYGAGAAAAGGLAIGLPGRSKSSRFVDSVNARSTSKFINSLNSGTKSKFVGGLNNAGKNAISNYNNSGMINKLSSTGKAGLTTSGVYANKASSGINRVANAGKNQANRIPVGTLARLGAGAVGLGLGVAAGRNAYRAATANKSRAKAQQFRSEMKKAFAGTQYANMNPTTRAPRKKRKTSRA